MDAHRGLNEDEADKALRQLFKAAGRVEAPAGMDARILQRIALTSKPPVTEPALLPKWVWIAGAMAFLGLAVFLLANSAVTTGPSYSDQLLQRVPEFSLAPLLTSPWLIFGSLAIGLLMALDVLLARQRARVSVA